MVRAFVDKKTIKEVAKIRHELHKNQASSRILSPDYQYIGLAGEYAFAKKYDLPIDLTTRVGGDGGCDFRVNFGTIDVKTARKALYLLVEVGRVRADIYVLAQFNNDSVTFMGWELGEEMEKCPAKDFGAGYDAHYKMAGELKSMEDLELLIQ